MKFINREYELSLLTDVLLRQESQMVIIYGRRRIGKTALILELIKKQTEMKSIYWVAHKSSSEILLEKFSKAVRPCLFCLQSQFSDKKPLF